jgi:hypothetical protein
VACRHQTFKNNVKNNVLFIRYFTKNCAEVSRHICELCGEETEMLRLHAVTEHADELEKVGALCQLRKINRYTNREEVFFNRFLPKMVITSTYRN